MDDLAPEVRRRLSTLLHQHRLAHITTKADGTVRRAGGALDTFGLSVATGAFVADILPVLHPLPSEAESIRIPLVHMPSGHVAHIEYVADADGATVFLFDVTPEYRRLVGLQQRMNEFRLLVTAEPDRVSTLVASLDALAIRVQGRTLTWAGPWPTWYDAPHPSPRAYVAEHPVLQHFITDADSLWTRPEPGALRSIPWQTDPDSGYFEALALRTRDAAWLLVFYPVAGELERIVQVGRVHALDRDLPGS